MLALPLLQNAVTALRYSPNGALLASGAKDTDIIVWDVAGEAGLCRLRGHKDQVTDLVRGRVCIWLFACARARACARVVHAVGRAAGLTRAAAAAPTWPVINNNLWNYRLSSRTMRRTSC